MKRRATWISLVMISFIVVCENPRNGRSFCTSFHRGIGNCNCFALSNCCCNVISFIRDIVVPWLITTQDIELSIYTSCKGMINHVNMSHTNSPSLVLSDNINIIIQLRQVVRNINMNIQFHHIHKPNEEELDTATGAEKILFKVHNNALSYFRRDKFHAPSFSSPEILFHLQQKTSSHKHHTFSARIRKKRYPGGVFCRTHGDSSYNDPTDGYICIGPCTPKMPKKQSHVYKNYT